MKKTLSLALSASLLLGSVFAYSPTSADQELQEMVEGRLEIMASEDINSVVSIANKVVEILPKLDVDGRSYYFLDWMYDEIVDIVDEEKERRASLIAGISTESEMVAHDHHMDSDDNHAHDDHSDHAHAEDADHSHDQGMDSTSDDMDEAQADMTPTVIVDVDGFNFGYSPSMMTVKKGDYVQINFKSSGGLHDFVIDEFDVDSVEVNPNSGVITVMFMADEVGTFEYYCSVGSHRAEGMVGTLTVTE